MYAFTNHFSRSALYHRVGMINRRRSGPAAWGRYVMWAGLMGVMVLACRHRNSEDDFVTTSAPNANALPATTPTRALVVALEDKKTWYRHMALFRSKFGTELVESNPVVLQVKADRLSLPDDYRYASAIYINGREAPVEALGQIAPEYVHELFVMHQWENQPDIDTQAKPYQIMVQTSPKPVTFDYKRERFFTLLQAAAISKYPRGETHSFTMNQLLEATFFHDKNALVERTDNEHLKVYDEFTANTEVFINNLPATSADVATVHVREVARLYTKERPYTEWFRADSPLPRFTLHIQTDPKRAKRDSSYYVFSPFYTGDF